MTQPDIDQLVRPLSARSLIASALLGTHPPALPGRLLVAMAQRFGLSGGTARVALSRMVDRGELVNDDGTYRLSGDLLERQERQDESRRTTPERWDGSWEQAIVTAAGRSSAERAELRRSLTTLALGERREGVWMRPANLEPGRQPTARATAGAQVEWFRLAPIDDEQGRVLVGELFDLEGWATTATALVTAMDEARRRLESDDDAVVSGFNLASAALRHLVHDPRLPSQLAPPGWPADDLRRAYEEFERSYQLLLRHFFRSAT